MAGQELYIEGYTHIADISYMAGGCVGKVRCHSCGAEFITQADQEWKAKQSLTRSLWIHLAQAHPNRPRAAYKTAAGDYVAETLCPLCLERIEGSRAVNPEEALQLLDDALALHVERAHPNQRRSSPDTGA